MNYAQYGKSPHFYVTEKDIDVRKITVALSVWVRTIWGVRFWYPEYTSRYSVYITVPNTAVTIPMVFRSKA